MMGPLATTGPVLFLIPARGGSKGIPRKNLATLVGRPLIAHVLEAARRAVGALELGGRVVVSTDDAEIARVARACGAETPFLRPAELALDHSTDLDVLLHALDWLASQEGFVPEVLVELQATSPFVSPEDIRGALELFLEDPASPVSSVAPVSDPPEWSFAIDGAGRLTSHRGERWIPVRRQDLRPAWRLNGAVSIITPARLREARTFLTEDARAYPMPVERSVDIDEPADLAYAEFLAARSAERPGFDVGGRWIDSGGRCFVIAEAGVNHNGDPELAHRLVEAAVDAGADAVKFQTFRAEALCAPETPMESYMVEGAGEEASQLAMLQALELPAETVVELKAHAERLGVVFLSTPFDEVSADFLDELGVAAFKIGSGEATHLPLLRHVAAKGKPVLLSTGMCTMDEVAEAVSVIRSSGAAPLALFHCVSCYPADPADCNLKAIRSLERRFGVAAGFSDHTLGHDAALAALAAGAVLIEKHLTLDRALPGPDHRASLDPEQFREMIDAIRRAEAMLGDGTKRPVECEEEGIELGRRSLFAAVDIAAGEEIRRDMIAVLRPGTGVHPRELDAWVGRAAPADFPRGTALAEP